MIYKKAENYLLINDKMQNMFQYIDKGSIATIITDPPYELNFMGKGWDKSGVAFQEDTWKHCYDALKDGGYLIVFGGSRTFHRVACAIEDAGFEIRDTMMWLYGSGFPKSQNVGLMIDKRNGVESIDTGVKSPNARPNCTIDNTLYESGTVGKNFNIKKANNKWNGWGTCLKPAYEPIIVARKPFKSTLVDNVINNGVGAINIDECRVGNIGGTKKVNTDECKESLGIYGNGLNGGTCENIEKGRFPANVITDGSDEVAMGMPIREKPNGSINKPYKMNNQVYGEYGYCKTFTSYGDEGSAMRYFYTAKASKKDRDEGLDMFESKQLYYNDRRGNSFDIFVKRDEKGNPLNPLRKNIHPTVKPVDLMQYLVRLFTPKGETIMDCFMGSGSTGKATMFENRERQANYKFVGIEMTNEYLPICEARIDYALNKYEYEIEKENKEDKDKGVMNIFDFM